MVCSMTRWYLRLFQAWLISSCFCALAQSQTVTVSPTTLSFGSQIVSTTSAAKAVTLKNGQSVALTISSIAASTNYAQSNNCGTSLAAGASCKINVTFTPTATGTHTGTLTITDNASNSPQTVSLTGTGVLPATLTPASLAFGNQVVGISSASKAATLKNNQTSALTISSITTSGDYGQTNACGTSLAAGASCTINVTFTPTATGSRPGTLTVTDSASNSPQTINLTGAGVAAPHITSASPTSGAPGTSVTITGTGFGATQGASGVTFNGTAGTPTSWSATKIVVPVPTGASTGNVVVTANGGTSNGVLFTVTPAITSLAPTSGPVGTFVTITGTNFGATQGTSTVTFNGTAATPTSWSATSIVVPVPSGATTGPVVVTVNGVASNGLTFTVLPTPTITSMAPTSGPVGTSVTITGTNFGATQGTSTVTFNGTAATPTSWSATSIVVPVPSGATTGPVVVTVNGVASNGITFTVLPTPTITSLAPTSGPVGTSVTITGTNFGATQGTSTVTFNGTSATPGSWSATSIVVPVPAGATTGPIVVTVNGVASNGITFTVLPTPAITSLAPTSGPVGTSVTITGTSFGATQGTSTVTFNGTSATPTGWSDTSIVVPVPSGATTGPVVLTVNGVASNGITFTVAPTPAITGLAPTSGPVGTSVTITGTNFGATQGTSTVTFNGTAATPSSWSATSIVVPVPAGATTGPVVVTVNGVASNGITFTVLPTPTITSLAPTSGAVGTSVTITGTSFGGTQGTSTVTFNGTSATPNSWSDTSIVVPVPAGATTGPVVVTVNGVASNGITFTVLQGTPTITSLSPTSGPVGTSVTITGTNFGATQGSSFVTVNGAFTSPSSWSSTSIVVQVPSGTTTGPVVVTVNNVASNGITFTVSSGPGITGVSPTTAPIGGTLNIFGGNFGATQGTSTVTLNGTAATPTSWSSTFISTIVPAGATSGNVIVTVGGVASNAAAVTVVPAPNIASLSPSSGPIGASITVSGTNFGATASSLSFNGRFASPTTWTDTSIVAPVPTGTTSGNVVVNVDNVNSNGVSFTVLPTPNVATLSPFFGAVGTSVTLTGTNFGATQGSSTITFNGSAATPSSWSATSIVVPVPAGATTGSIVVTSLGVPSNPVPFIVLGAPALTSLSHTSGPVGQSVTISGSSFGANQGSSTVTFNGTSTSPTYWSNSQIITPVPAGATTGPVVVTVNGTVSNAVTFTVGSGQAPSIELVSPSAGAVGTAISIYGANFGTTQGSSTVAFNGTPGSPTFWNSTLIVVPVPVGATTGNVAVTVNGKASNGVNFTVASVPALTFVTSSAPVGSSIGIQGTNFGPSQGSSLVTINGLEVSPNSWTATSISLTVPANATSGPVVVTVGGVPSNALNFTVSPSITTITPGLAAAGTSVTITGLNFGATQGASTVSFNGTAATPTSWSSNQITVPVPATATTGSVFVTVGGLSSTSFWFTVGSAPTITSITPASGPVNQPVTITGTNFGSSQIFSTLTFNGTNASVSSWSGTQILTSVPSTATSGNVVVTISGTPSNGVLYTVNPGPGILRVSPTTGGIGTTVSVSGNGFGVTQGSSTLTFNGVAATPTSWSDTFVQATVPTGAATGPVVITNSAASNAVTFTVVTTPTIQNVSPSSAHVGQSVNINGYGFGAMQGASTVTFNGIAVTPSNWTLTAITVPIPAGTTTGPVIVSVGGVSSNSVTFTLNVSGTITSISPTLGPVGTQVTISGSGFGATQGTSTVTFNGTTATPTSWSDTAIVVPVPTNATRGCVIVAIGGFSSNCVIFTVGSQPSITSVLPSSGPVGSVVTITGTSFGATQNGATIAFNGLNASVTSWSDTSIVATVPSTATTGNVIVTLGGVPSNGVLFTVNPGPGITKLSRTTGAPTVAVTVTGAGFGVTQGTSTLTFNGVPATATSWSSTFIQATVPVGATTGNVVVTVGGIASNGSPFTVSPAATITGIAPTFGSSSPISITVTGSGFGATQGSSTIMLSTPGTIYSLSVKSWSDTSIVGQLFPNSVTDIATGPLVVTTANSGVASNPAYFTILPTPNITTMSPSSGTVGTVVTLTGTGFGLLQGNSTVTFNGAPGIPTAWSDTSITVPAPVAGSTGPVVVTVDGVASAGKTFTLPPVLTSISPASGWNNVPVTLTGSGFASGIGSSTVKFNGTLAHPTSWSTNTIVVPVPNLATTGPIVVTVSGISTSGINFTITVPSGTLNGTVTAAGLPVSGAFVEALQGGLQKATARTAVDGTYSINSLTPGPYDVRVTATGYLVTTSPGWTVTTTAPTVVNIGLLSPTITSISPAAGPAGTSVTITGSNFGPSQGTSAVTFNGAPASPTSWTATVIVAPVPAAATSGPVVVTEGGVASNAISFSIGSGSVTGTVTAASTGNPVSGATVEILKSNAVVASSTTASNGTYTISNINPGTYDLLASASGLGTQTQPGSVIGTAPFTANFALPTPGTSSGQVVRSDGITTIPNATVTITQSGINVGGASTDASGNYSITNLSPGSYSGQASSAGFGTATSPLTITANTTTTTNYTLSSQSTISYTYDELGRLIGVNDSQNGTVTYTYDAVGNVLSISRTAANQIVITGFSPKTGVTGTQVTISGAGFSPTPSQNSVSFNGTAAVIVSSTATQIVTTLPAGATSGTISVSSPLGTATSSQSFTVTSSSSAPTITGFSPPIVVYGTPVTITGTNFDPTAAKNVANFNTSFAAVNAATSTSLTASVNSGAPSGHISVALPAGKAVTSSDIYVAPPPFAASSVAFTGRTTFGNPIHVTIGTANDIGLVIFDAVAGQRASIQFNNGSFLSCSISNGGTNVSVLSPSGATVGSGFCLQPGTSYIDTFPLHDTGTYTVVIMPQSGGTGSVDVTVNSVPNDITTTITPGGPPVTITTSIPGQNANLTFSGTQGQKIALQLSNGTYPGCSVTSGGVNVTILNPDGSTLIGDSCLGSGAFIDATLLPETGTYTIFFDPTSSFTGSMTFTLYNVVDVNTSIQIGGPPVVVTTTIPGQNAYVTFSATQNQIVTLQMTNGTYPGCSVTSGGVNVTFNNPDGTKLAGFSCLGSQDLSRIVLPQTGTYTIFFDPTSNYTGSMTLTLLSVVDVNVPITPGGSPVTVTTNTVGQYANLTFSGTSGQRISLNLTNGTYPGCTVLTGGITVQILNPDNSILTQAGCLGTPFFFDVTSLSQNGTYTIRVNPTPYTGSITLTLYLVPPDFTGSVTLNGTPPLTVTTTVLGQNANVTFSANAGQPATVKVTNNTMGNVTVSLINPSGATITSTTSSAASFNLTAQTSLPATGTYTVSINPSGTNTGSMGINVTSP